MSAYAPSRALTLALEHDQDIEAFPRVQVACAIVAELVPHDGQWHPRQEIIQAAAARGIPEHLCKRARTRLGLEHRRAWQFARGTEWRWPNEDNENDSATTPHGLLTTDQKPAADPWPAPQTQRWPDQWGPYAG